MKKQLVITAAILLTIVAKADNKTRIGGSHAIDFGIYYGYATGNLANHGGGFMDINAQRSNLRTRLNFEIQQINIEFCPAAGVELLYMVPLDNLLSFYPLAGIQAEHHKEPSWTSTFELAPEAGFGFEFQFGKSFGYFLQGKYKYGILGTGSCVMGQTGFIFAFGPGKRGPVKVAAMGANLAEALKARDEADDAQRAEAMKKEQSEAKAKAAAEAQEARIAAKTEAETEAARRISSYNILFPIGSAFVSENGRVWIAEAVKFLEKHPDATVEIKGYADKECSSAEENKTLSRKRAEAVKDFFISAGVPEYKIKAEYFGDTVSPFNSAEANRVVTINTK